MSSDHSTGHSWCWTCGDRRDGAESYLHRGGNPVLAHGRCGVCHDVLMSYPQPTFPEKREHLGIHLREAMRWSRVVTTDEPTDDEHSLAVGEIRELLLQAHRVYVMKLESQDRSR
ncbi:hypothetical protein SAMN05421630_115146 [Prauserella marina]|uniref:Uncharacterized protein n=1 Tax=Prauserella marina TaxID=530584 RepID=A0A1G6Z641_9PSEU|nr:hypothetical protein [Prauserella marina]PWV71417.1 hypothetical protein DES30_112133 [Prauserella marina]SDD98139.1 hypothetical protein SAMN05421630_115146 [Prauserella marina]